MNDLNLKDLEIDQIKAKNKLKLLEKKLSDLRKRMKLNGIVLHDKYGRGDFVPIRAIPPQSLYKSIRKTHERIATNRSLIKVYVEVEKNKPKQLVYNGNTKTFQPGANVRFYIECPKCKKEFPTYGTNDLDKYPFSLYCYACGKYIEVEAEEIKRTRRAR